MYILKTKGTAKIPDYVQIRDDNFVLICHFRVDKPHQALDKQDFIKSTEEIIKVLENSNFGVLTKVDL